VVVKDAVSVRARDGLKSSAVEWFTHMYSSFVELIRKNIQDLPLV
jgi:hypothetical protein